MILDSSAWVEFFEGSEKGMKVQGYFEEEKIFTSIVSLAEITNWSLKNNLNPEEYVSIVERYSQIIDLNKDIVSLAGKINFEHKKKIHNWGMLDSFIYATALFYDLKLLTKDHHFQGLSNVVLI